MPEGPHSAQAHPSRHARCPGAPLPPIHGQFPPPPPRHPHIRPRAACPVPSRRPGARPHITRDILAAPGAPPPCNATPMHTASSCFTRYPCHPGPRPIWHLPSRPPAHHMPWCPAHARPTARWPGAPTFPAPPLPPRPPLTWSKSQVPMRRRPTPPASCFIYLALQFLHLSAYVSVCFPAPTPPGPARRAEALRVVDGERHEGAVTHGGGRAASGGVHHRTTARGHHRAVGLPPDLASLELDLRRQI